MRVVLGILCLRHNDTTILRKKHFEYYRHTELNVGKQRSRLMHTLYVKVCKLRDGLCKING